MPADGTGAANWENGDFGGSRFYGQLFRFSDKNCLPCVPYGYANFEHNGAGLDSALYLSTP
jgi:hypothetical protein